MTYQKRIEQLREEYKWANPVRRESIKCLVKAIKIKHRIPWKEEHELEEDVKEALL